MIPMRSQITMVILYAMGYIHVRYRNAATYILLSWHMLLLILYWFSFRRYMKPMRSQITRVIMYTVLLNIFDWIYLYINSPSVFSHILCTYCIYCIYVFMQCLWANRLRNKWTWTWTYKMYMCRTFLYQLSHSLLIGNTI